MTETELAYVAGVIDSDGCIHASVATTGGFVLRAQVGMYAEELVKWLHTSFGGSYSSYQKDNSRKRMHHWTISGAQCGPFLELILPYLRVKRKQAELAIAFSKLVGFKGKTPDSVFLMKLRLSGAISKLNDEGRGLQ